MPAIPDVYEATFENQPRINELMYSPLQREEDHSILSEWNKSTADTKRDKSSEDIASDNETLQHGGDRRNEVIMPRYVMSFKNETFNKIDCMVLDPTCLFYLLKLSFRLT